MADKNQMDRTCKITDQVLKSNPLIKRLVILLPEETLNQADLDEAGLARTINRLAVPTGLSILLIGLANDLKTEAYIRQRIISLTALVRSLRYQVTTRVYHGNQWAKNISNLLQDDDLIVCSSSHAFRSWIPWVETFDKQLVRLFHRPVYLMPGLDGGFYRQHALAPHKTPINQILGWSVSMAIIIAFLGADITFTQRLTGWSHGLIIGIALAAEVATLWVWNGFWG